MRIGFIRGYKEKNGKPGNEYVLGCHFYKNPKSIERFAEKHPKFLKTIGIINIFIFIICIFIGIFSIGGFSYYKYTKDINYYNAIQSGDKQKIEETKAPYEKINNISSIGVIYPTTSNEMEIKNKYFIGIPWIILIISLFITMFVHEFGHYLMFVANKVKIKSYGFGFLFFYKIIPLPFPIAYVEAVYKDYKKLKKSKRKFPYLSMVCSGVGFNVVLGLISLPFALIDITLFFYLFLINIGIAITNTLPLFITDGASFFKKLIGNSDCFSYACVGILLYGSINIIKWVLLFSD